MLNELASHSRVWIYQADRDLKDNEIEFIKSEMNAFIREWASHGNELYGRSEVRDNLFLIVGVDEKKSPPSGCSIDSLVRKIQEIGSKIKVDFFNRLNIAIKQEEKIDLISMAEFKDLARKDLITSQTTVYNNLIERLEELDSQWITTVGNSWHKNLLEVL